MVAVAIGAAAVVGGATSIIAGNKSASAVRDAANASNDTQRYIYDQTRADYAPWKAVGQGALGKLAGMYGVGGGASAGGGGDWSAYLQNNPDVAQGYAGVDKTQFPTPEAFAQWHYQNYGQNEGRQLPGSTTANDNADPYGGFTKSPGYQFQMDEGLKAIERSAAARGGLRSGATMKALTRFAEGTAANDYNNYQSHLMQLAGLGQSATGSTAQAGQNYATGTASNNMNAGNAQASSYANTGSAINQGVGNLASMYLYNKGYGGGGVQTGGVNNGGYDWSPVMFGG